jgi:hypothetical protein
MVRASAVGTDVAYRWLKTGDTTFAIDGDVLYFDSVNKQQFGEYYCIASQGTV